MLLVIRLSLALLLNALLFHISTVSAHDATPQSSSPRPNIILFMTDDQDVTANSLDYMPRLNRLFRKEGMEFLHYYVPTGLCCPSRATILRGQYCHNTEIYDNGDLTNSTYQSGAWNKFLDTGLENETIATMLQSAGYETALIGKYINGYMGQKAAGHKPPGFDHWMGMLRLSFYGPSFSDNGEFLQLNETVYQTDFIRDWAIDFLTNKRDTSKPFFLMMTPFAPHTPATPAKRHEDMFQDASFPRYDSFNPSDEVQRRRPAWIKDLPPLTQKQIDDMDKFYRNRLRSLQAIDEALEMLVDTLHDLRIDDNTYIFYTSDNGQHFGSFRIPAGKRQAYESDVSVPFLVRGPGIQQGSQVKEVVQSVDLAPTFLDLAARSSRYDLTPPSYPMDGKSMLPLLSGEMKLAPAVNNYRWVALLEMYGGSSNIGPLYKNMSGYYHNHMFPNTYQAARIINGPGWAKGADLLYVEWCTGEQELYNMTVDPHQVDNIVGRINLKLLYRMIHLLAILGDCKGLECYGPDIFSVSKEALAPGRELMSMDSIKAAIRNRMPCHNPPNMTSADTSLGRKQFAVDLPIPEPFTFGFPYSDGDAVSDDLMEVWREYEHYFY